jgi:hypothetical protein
VKSGGWCLVLGGTDALGAPASGQVAGMGLPLSQQAKGRQSNAFSEGGGGAAHPSSSQTGLWGL